MYLKGPLQNSFIVIPAIDNPAATQWLLRGATVDLEAGIQVLQAFLDPGLRGCVAIARCCKFPPFPKGGQGGF
ncbi:hypothetical protein SBDP1_380042 [Syntrophobacter sp. SbD1]|nr:hypothetical protein SBDP1_380042 [Syntrophobacter sp. SbD1]